MGLPQQQARSYEGYGNCRRYPPGIVMMDGTPRVTIPVTKPDDWCGEHEPKPVALRPPTAENEMEREERRTREAMTPFDGTYPTGPKAADLTDTRPAASPTPGTGG